MINIDYIMAPCQIQSASSNTQLKPLEKKDGDAAAGHGAGMRVVATTMADAGGRSLTERPRTRDGAADGGRTLDLHQR